MSDSTWYCMFGIIQALNGYAICVATVEEPCIGTGFFERI